MPRMLISIMLTATIVIGTAAEAQTRRTAVRRRAPAAPHIPAAGMWGIGGSLGAAAPAEASLQNGLDVAGNIERYLTPRVSVRGQLGASWWDIQGHSFSGTIKPVFATANALYNWEGGAVHPYVTGGVGVYHFRAPGSSTVDRSDTKPGVNLGGGLEYFIGRRTTMGGELLYHKVGAFDTPLAAFTDGSFWRFGFGLKRYF